MKAKRSFPLTSVETVDYDESSDPKKFYLTFSNCVEILQAQTAGDASDWVEKIVQGDLLPPLLLPAPLVPVDLVSIIIIFVEFFIFTACAKWHIPMIEDSSTDELSQEAGEKYQPMDTQDTQSSITRLIDEESQYKLLCSLQYIMQVLFY